MTFGGSNRRLTSSAMLRLGRGRMIRAKGSGSNLAPLFATSESPMATVSELREHVLETLWSQWHELGIAAVVPRRHQNDVIDPEALIAFTATHSDFGARLRGESIDWVIRYGSFVFKGRLENGFVGLGVLQSYGIRG